MTSVLQFSYGSGVRAVLVRSDGTAALNWPSGDLAASLDIDETEGCRGYRLLAMYKSSGNVCVSFDLLGGFVQHPTGSLMLVFNKKDGTGKAYTANGDITDRWQVKR